MAMFFFAIERAVIALEQSLTDARKNFRKPPELDEELAIFEDNKLAFDEQVSHWLPDAKSRKMPTH